MQQIPVHEYGVPSANFIPVNPQGWQEKLRQKKLYRQKKQLTSPQVWTEAAHM
jgi:hypothetical protein